MSPSLIFQPKNLLVVALSVFLGCANRVAAQAPTAPHNDRLGTMEAMINMQRADLDQPQGNPHADIMPLQKAEKTLDWQVPQGWTEKATTSNLRVGYFVISGENGQGAEVTVIPLPGDAGGEIANVNLWRQQAGLDSQPDTETAKMIEHRAFPAGVAALVDIQGKENLIENRFRPRIIAATLQHNDTSWFFKMVGEDATVTAAKPAFIKFLESVKFRQ